jgi:thioredoxin-related protein
LDIHVDPHVEQLLMMVQQPECEYCLLHQYNY